MAKKMKYRLLSLAMAVVMAFTLLPAAALAEETVLPEPEPAVCTKLEGCTESTHAEGCPLYTKPEPASVPETVQAFLDAVEALEETEDSINACGAAYDALAEEEQAREDVKAAYAVFLAVVEAFNEPMLIPEEETAVYVSSSGDDTKNGTTPENAVATLAKAVEIARNGATIYVLSHLTMTECARFDNKNLTITSGDGGPYTVTRGDNFSQQQDNSRSTYNPAMIEAQADTEGGEYGLILKNIILDDGGKHMGTVFAQAISGEGKDDNRIYVQDAMIASNATVPCTITLGEGAVLRNFGGMSAVRVTAQAKLVMESGSKIEDTTVTDRVKGETVESAKSNGPAGAIWVQNASVEMKAGSEISNVIGRAVYVDGGKAQISGKIAKITADPDMWENTGGTALYLRNDASAELFGAIEKCSGGSLVFVNKATFEMKDGSLLGNSVAAGIVPCETASADHLLEYNSVIVNGEITGIRHVEGKTENNPIQFKYGTLTIGPSAKIHDNTAHYGAVYIQRDAIVHIYGKIYDNKASGRGGGIGTAGHGYLEINMYDGAEVKGNIAGESGGGASLKNCKLTMYGGEISNNSSKLGGGIFLYSDATAEIKGGRIENNLNVAGQNNEITISEKQNGNSNRYLYISPNAFIDNSSMINMEKESKTIIPNADSKDIKLHNASTESSSALKSNSTGKGWSSPIATFWTQRDSAANLTVGGLNLNADQQGNTLPVYVLTQKTGEDGKPASSDAPIGIYAATVDADGSVNCTLPGGDVNGSGCAVAIVQATVDYGSLVITGPNKITENKTAATYEVPYTATYTMSQNLASVIEQGKAGINDQTCSFTFVVELDSRLTAKTGTGDYAFTSPIFDVDTVTGSGSTLTVTCKLKSDWKEHIDELLTNPMTLTGTGVLDAKDFAAGDTLATTGNIQVTIPNNNIYIPANSCLTEMAALIEYTITASAGSNGSISPSGKVSVPEGGSKTFTITPDSGYRISDVKVDGKSVGAVSSYTFKDVDTNHTITASFARSNYDDDDDDKGKDIKDPEVPLGGLQLNKDDHFAYIKGYADGTVRPNNFITRAQVATIFYRLMTEETRMLCFSDTNDFSDVPADYWANKAISTLSNAGIITGFSDGTFRPNAFITRAQFAAIAARFSVVTEDLPNPFSDVPEGYWAEDLIAYAAHLGWVNGYPDGTFRPTANITRAAAMKLINNVLERQVDEDGLLEDAAQWNDCTPDDWCYYIVMEATNSHDWERRSKKSLVEDWTALTADPVWDE